jgi:hypothetical protein
MEHRVIDEIAPLVAQCVEKSEAAAEATIAVTDALAATSLRLDADGRRCVELVHGDHGFGVAIAPRPLIDGQSIRLHRGEAEMLRDWLCRMLGVPEPPQRVGGTPDAPAATAQPQQQQSVARSTVAAFAEPPAVNEPPATDALADLARWYPGIYCESETAATTGEVCLVVRDQAAGHKLYRTPWYPQLQHAIEHAAEWLREHRPKGGE